MSSKGSEAGDPNDQRGLEKSDDPHDHHALTVGLDHLHGGDEGHRRNEQEGRVDPHVEGGGEEHGVGREIKK